MKYDIFKQRENGEEAYLCTVTITPNNCFLNWAWHTSEPKTEEQAEELQLKNSYHPAGYGLYAFDCRLGPDDGYISTWFCDNSTGD